jgi:hypothetical protein
MRAACSVLKLKYMSDMRKEQELIETAAMLMQREQLEVEPALRAASQRMQWQPRRWPKPELVLGALQARLQLFGKATSADTLARMREAALQAMRTLKSGPIKATGAVVDGVVLAHRPVHLQVLCEPADLLYQELLELKIPAKQVTRRDQRSYFEFKADGIAFRIDVLTDRSEFAEGALDVKAIAERLR